jgi:hypothetical protein
MGFSTDTPWRSCVCRNDVHGIDSGKWATKVIKKMWGEQVTA